MLHRCLVELGKFDRILGLMAMVIVLGTIAGLVLLSLSAGTLIVCNTCVTVVGFSFTIYQNNRRAEEDDRKFNRILELLEDRSDIRRD